MIGKCLALSLGDIGAVCVFMLIRIHLSVWFHTDPVVGRKTLETSRDFVVVLKETGPVDNGVSWESREELITPVKGVVQ